MRCYKCKCQTCINNTSETKIGDELVRKGGNACFNCEDCYNYGRDPGAPDNKKRQCLAYIKSDRAIAMEKLAGESKAANQRKTLKVVRGGLI